MFTGRLPTSCTGPVVGVMETPVTSGVIGRRSDAGVAPAPTGAFSCEAQAAKPIVTHAANRFSQLTEVRMRLLAGTYRSTPLRGI
jgi:hypothetical protein